MVGGAISGYWAIGRVRERGARGALSRAVALARRRELGHLRVDRLAGADAGQAVDDDDVVARKPFPDHPVPVDARTDADRLERDLVVRADRVDDAAVLVGADGLVRHEHALV